MRDSNQRLSVRPCCLLSLLAALLLLGFTSSQLSAADWLQFRGEVGGRPRANTAWPERWEPERQLGWSTEIAGQGWSSPLIIGDRAYVTSALSDEIGQPAGFGRGVASMATYRKDQGPQEPVSFRVTALNLADGKPLWEKEVGLKRPLAFFHPSNTYATESPTSDGEFLYATFQAVGIVACVDLDGELVWSRDFGAYKTGNDFGTGSSLALHDGKLYVQNDNEEQSFLVCLDAKTGKDVWRKERSGKTCWSTPLVWHSTAGVQLVVCGSEDVVGLDPDTGEQRWRVTGMGGSFSASPVADRDRVYFGNSGPGRRGPLVAVNADAQGELQVSDPGPGIAWVARSAGPGMSSPLVVNDRIYIVGRGTMTCYETISGKRVYRARLPHSDNVAASLIGDQQRLLILDEAGHATVVKTGDTFEVLAENTLEGLFWSTPAADQNHLLLRSADRIYCIRGQQ